MSTSDTYEADSAGSTGGQTANERVPVRWPAIGAFLAIGLAFWLLPSRLKFGPDLLLPAAVVLLLVPIEVARQRGNHLWMRALGFIALGIVTLALAVSASLLVRDLPTKTRSATDLLRNAAVIWAINIVVFALWYWEVDAGGPRARQISRYESVDFAFPQFQLDNMKLREWKPGFLDYLFLAFNTNTAFSPTDTMVLSQKAKVLMMTQSALSLVVLAVLAARAINTL
jgi:hypothetical protein